MRTRGRGRGGSGRGRGRKSNSTSQELNNATNEPSTSTGQRDDDNATENVNVELEQENVQKKRKRCKPLELSHEQQENVVEWYKDNELLYNKGHFRYKGTVLKTARWQAKSAELGIDDWKTLRTWVDSMRSQLGRLTREGKKSRSGRKEETQRDKWIKEKFAFLEPHIARVTTRPGVNLKEKLKARYRPDSIADSSSEQEDEQESQDDDDSRSQCDPEETPRTSLNVTKKRKKSDSKVQSSTEEETKEAIKQSSSLQSRIQEKLAVHIEMAPERHSWGQWMLSILPSIDERLWSRFKRESMDMLDRFQSESNDLRSRDKNRLPQLQGIAGQQSAMDVSGICSSSSLSSTGYLPTWQHQYQLPGQDLPFQGNRFAIQNEPQARPLSAPPMSCPQGNVANTMSDSSNIDSPSTSTLFAL